MIEPDVDRRIGRRIQALRVGLDLSQGDLALRLRDAGVNWAQGTLSKVENGDRPVRLSEGPVVAAVLGITVEALISEGGALEGFFRQARHAERSAKVALDEAKRVVELTSRRRQYMQMLKELASAPPAERYVVPGRDLATFLQDVQQGVGDIDGVSLSVLARELGAEECELENGYERNHTMIEGLLSGDKGILRQIPAELRTHCRSLLAMETDDSAKRIVLDIWLEKVLLTDVIGRLLPHVQFEPSTPAVSDVYVRGIYLDPGESRLVVDAS